jgi:hypothetical protein
MYDSEKTFGFVLLAILQALPAENTKPWDKDIRW